ncbi:cyclic nucleotide-binding domain-containing protein [Lacisediminimonas sp.]|uniref:cyclic nucleotide-binding domain-containing protein n=1 Tax=Lacisediminimonas sp. TaxID=3060582 RepID=UPI0027248E08|nr:cyclic nucleotide-binding domain-containing protein [Lacisediminimonas sp.]MDO8300216.1 cyclic nucleotide-binding domain-containing protein [Lacisediminimonas sp.]MDO9217150.1 cyclic nucleotide-binding domain-containing protein [Lacisediminimonas sp.]
MQTDSLQQLRQVTGLSPLSEGGLQEISRLAKVYSFPRGTDLLTQDDLKHCTFYLLDGQLRVVSIRSGGEVMVGGTTSSAGLRQSPDLQIAEAITEVRLLCIATDLLDVTLIWDQLNKEPAGSAAGTNARAPGSVAGHLLSGALAAITPDRIALLLERFKLVRAVRGQVIVREGEPGDQYYVIDDGRCIVTRQVGNVETELAELRPGDGFGEEALLGNGVRNATVTMSSDGHLYCLSRQDFDVLLREPLLRQLAPAEAMKKSDEAIWIDVRFPSEFSRDRLPWAINIPLGEIRNIFSVLNRSGEYIVYCQNGSRSAAAAFLLAQAGCKAWSLQGGLEALAASGISSAASGSAPAAADGTNPQ